VRVQYGKATLYKKRGRQSADPSEPNDAAIYRTDPITHFKQKGNKVAGKRRISRSNSSCPLAFKFSSQTLRCEIRSFLNKFLLVKTLLRRDRKHDHAWLVTGKHADVNFYVRKQLGTSESDSGIALDESEWNDLCG